MNAYALVIRRGVSYYIREELLGKTNGSEINLQQLSDFVIDGNKLIKSRYPISDVLLAFVRNNLDNGRIG